MLATQPFPCHIKTAAKHIPYLAAARYLIGPALAALGIQMSKLRYISTPVFRLLSTLGMT